MTKIVLASASPRRRQLLEWAELKFDVLSRETPEVYPDGMSMEEIPVHVARQKALIVQTLDLYKRYESHMPILAADTIVILDGKILGKPESKADAINMLLELSGKKHTVITGVVILFNDREVSFSDTTEVEFHHIDPEDIHYYVEKYLPLDKAGAYAIQEWIGVIGIKSISGDFYNVMGLPISRVLRALRDNFWV
jgi:septum formation protein